MNASRAVAPTARGVLSALLLLTVACNLRGAAPPPAAATPVSPLAAATAASGTPGALAPQDETERLYTETVRRQAEPVVASIGRFNELVKVPRPQNADWKNNLNREIDLWPSFAPQAEQLQPPPRYRRFHDAYVEALRHMAVAANLMREVQNTGIQGIVPEINSRINEANQAFAEANRRSDIVPPARISVILGSSLVPRT